MEPTATISELLLETGRSLATLQQRLSSDEDFQDLARQLGWDIPTLPAPLANLLPQLVQLEAAVQAVLLDVASPNNLAALNTSVTTVYTAIKNLANETYTLPLPLDTNVFRAEFPKQLLTVLLVDYLQTYQSQIYGLLYGVSLITREYIPASVGRVAYIRVGLSLNLLADLLRNPVSFWRTVYGWGGTFAYDRLVMAVGELLDRLGVPTGYLAADYVLLTIINPGPIPGALPIINALQVNLLHTITSLGEFYIGMQLLPVLSPTGTPQGVALAAQALGALNESIDLGNNFSLNLVGEAGLAAGIGLALQPTQPLQVKSLTSAGAAMNGKFEAAIRRLPTGVADTPRLLLRTPGNTELTYGTVTWRVGVLASTTAASDLYTELRINALRFASGEGDNDSFLSQVLKNFYFKTDISVGVSKVKGFYFDSSAGLSTKQIKTIKLGSVQLNYVAIAVATDPATSFTYLTVLSDLVADLGPIRASLTGVGLKAGFKYDVNGGDIGPFSTDIAVKTPSGIGITVDSDTLTGGGYLFLDPARNQYAGVANLKLKTAKQEINLNALGLLQTELPGNPDAYSLLLLITATFHPIQLGLGFTLNGIGGLLGVNRATDTDYLRGLVRGGHLNQLLFPANVLDNPAATLALVDAAFPATAGRYVIGLLARLGWGTPTSLLTLDVALLIELPAPVRLALLGVLEATLPSKDQDLLKLRADFLGTVDFGAKRAAFDATLSDSHLLAFALTGDLAFRFYQGQNPLFVLTAGGFHPAFQPPAGAGLTGLRRLTLALARGNELRVTLTSYLAVTSNTVQFGSHLALYYRLARGLRVEGYFGFDVLFQFSPFHVQAHIEAGVAINYGSRELLSLHLALDVTGPGPWHIWGRASFKVWFVRIHVDVDATIGSGQTEPALPATDVQALLVTALNAATSWEVEAPPTALPGGVVLRPVGPTEAPFFLDPRGALLLRQRVVPLGVPLGRYGRGPITPATGQRFDLTALVVAGVRHAVAPDKAVETVRDFFAPDQFQPLTDAQKLSLPSFQRLPCGVRRASLAGLVADDKATLRVVEYEHKLIGGVSGGATTSRPPKMSARGYQQLVRGGALGQEVAAAQPSARAPQPVNWAEDAYVVVHAATLEVYEPVSHARFATQVEAEAYRQGLVAATPALADEVLVVPAYQLELA